MPFPHMPQPKDKSNNNNNNNELSAGGGFVPGIPGKRDPNIKVRLENEDLWRQFDGIGTEMIITKMGR